MCNTANVLSVCKIRVEDTLDQWGRPKKSTLRMPTEALPEQDRESLPQVDVSGCGMLTDNWGGTERRA
eukprot:scaffold25590_cov19-Tisochrysis_lutea.AAC.2